MFRRVVIYTHLFCERQHGAGGGGITYTYCCTATGGRSGGASGASGESRRRDARTVPTTASRDSPRLKHVDGVARRDTLHRSLSTQASRRSTSVVGARAATTAAACSGAVPAPSTSWPARSIWRRTATPWSTTSTQQREWSQACSTRNRRCKHSCFSSSS